jgi:hypothetical protein
LVEAERLDRFHRSRASLEGGIQEKARVAVDADIGHATALADDFIERRMQQRILLRETLEYLRVAGGFFTVMDDRLRVSHSTVRQHVFDILHQRVALLLQLGIRRLSGAQHSRAYDRQETGERQSGRNPA